MCVLGKNWPVKNEVSHWGLGVNRRRSAIVLPQVTYLAAEGSHCESRCMIYDARHDEACLDSSHLGGLEHASHRFLIRYGSNFVLKSLIPPCAKTRSSEILESVL
jgi:hypothetical protein